MKSESIKSRFTRSAACPGVLALLLLGGCGSAEAPPASVELANPASQYCVEKGGVLEIVRDDSGEKGMCRLPDGTVVEEWELFRRDNPQPR